MSEMLIYQKTNEFSVVKKYLTTATDGKNYKTKGKTNKGTKDE